MKLILTQDVQGLGAPGDIVTVKDGYGRNFLLPQRLATAWTKGAEKQITQIKRARDARSIRDADHANEVKQQLEGLKVALGQRAGETGKLFGSVTVGDVADAIRAAGGPLLDKRTITLDHPIKTVGKHGAKVQLLPSVSASVTLEVAAN